MATCKVGLQSSTHCGLIAADVTKLWVLVHNGVSEKVQRFEAVDVLQLSVQCRNVVILSVDFSQVLKLLNTAEVHKLVAREVDLLKAGQLHHIGRDLDQTHIAEVNGAFVSTLRVPDLQLYITHFRF